MSCAAVQAPLHGSLESFHRGFQPTFCLQSEKWLARTMSRCWPMDDLGDCGLGTQTDGGLKVSNTVICPNWLNCVFEKNLDWFLLVSVSNLSKVRVWVWKGCATSVCLRLLILCLAGRGFNCCVVGLVFVFFILKHCGIITVWTVLYKSRFIWLELFLRCCTVYWQGTYLYSKCKLCFYLMILFALYIHTEVRMFFTEPAALSISTPSLASHKRTQERGFSGPIYVYIYVWTSDNLSA